MNAVEPLLRTLVPMALLGLSTMWMRLRPFFDPPGTIMVDGNRTVVTFRGFNDRQLNRDLAEICATVRERQSRLPDGTTLVCEMAQHRGLISERQ